MEYLFKSCCFTGYRPQKFPFPLVPDNRDYIDFENRLTDIVFSLPDDECFRFYSGMAMGFDLIAAKTVLLLREARPDMPIELISVIPFIEQSASFPAVWKEQYDEILGQADETILISDKYYSGCYRKRNEFMVNSSDYVVTWFDGRPGGTKSTVDYAAKCDKTVINLFDRPMNTDSTDNTYELIL